MSDSLSQHATVIALSELKAAEAHAGFIQAQAHRQKIGQRLAALANERNAIVSRRAGGDDRPDDAGTLALIAADTEGLQGLLPDADAQLATGEQNVRAANADLAGAKADFKAEEVRVALAALDNHADRLIGLLAKTLAERTKFAAAAPAHQRNLGAIVTRLHTFDAVLTGELRQLTAATFQGVPFPQQPTWRPSDFLYDKVWRQHANQGRFV